MADAGQILLGLALRLLYPARRRLDARQRLAAHAHVLPGLLVMGLGLGLVFAPAMSSATLGVEPSDAGVASATVNTMQQIGGSIGTALLSTLAASATTGAIADAGTAPTKAIVAQAAIHGYTTAFYWSAAIFAVAAIVCTALLRSGVHEPSEAAEPVFAH